MARLCVEEVGQLPLIDPVLMVLRKRQRHVLPAEIRELGPVRVAARRALALALSIPPFHGSVVLVLGDPPVVEQAAEDYLPADVELRSQRLRGRLGCLPTCHRTLESVLRHEHVSREAVADHLDLPSVAREALNVTVANLVDAAGVENEVRQLVEVGENLPRLRRAVVRVDNRELVVVEAEPREVLRSERVLEDEHADVEQRGPPLLQRRVITTPCLLLLDRHTDVLPHRGRHRGHVHVGCELQVSRDEAVGRVPPLGKLRQVDLHGFGLAHQHADPARQALQLGLRQRAERLINRGHVRRIREEEDRNRHLKRVR